MMFGASGLWVLAQHATREYAVGGSLT